MGWEGRSEYYLCFYGLSSLGKKLIITSLKKSKIQVLEESSVSCLDSGCFRFSLGAKTQPFTSVSFSLSPCFLSGGYVEFLVFGVDQDG